MCSKKMKVITFYSFKGGVGRTLLLANTALFLARANKRVVMLDLDFEAPGLPYKFGVKPERGLVDYLVSVQREKPHNGAVFSRFPNAFLGLSLAELEPKS